MGSSLLAGAFATACVKCFVTLMLGQGDSYLGFSFPFCPVKLGRCLEFSPLPSYPSEIYVKHPCDDSAPLGDLWGISPTSSAAISPVRKSCKSWPQLLWLTRAHQGAGSGHKGLVWKSAKGQVWSFRVAFITHI